MFPPRQGAQSRQNHTDRKQDGGGPGGGGGGKFRLPEGGVSVLEGETDLVMGGADACTAMEMPLNGAPKKGQNGKCCLMYVLTKLKNKNRQ